MARAKEEIKLPFVPTRPPKEEVVKFNGADFLTTFWSVPEGVTVRGRVLFVHGFSEYYKVYLKAFEDLSEDGYEVFFFDQRGSGLTSPGSEKGLTNEYHTFNDLNFFIEKNLKDMEGKGVEKLFLSGHSMGGGIALNYGVNGKYKDQISGIAVTGPLIELHPGTRPSKVLFGFLSTVMRILPNMRIDTALKPEYVTSDPEWRKFATEDKVIVPLLGSLRQIHDFMKRGQKLLDSSYNKDFSVPVLIAHGADDKINDPEASKKFIEAIPIEDKKIVLPEGGRHSLLIEKEEIYRDVINVFLHWFDSHI